MKIYKKLTLCLLTLFSLILLTFNFNISAQADNNVSVHLNYIDAASGHKLQNDTTISGEVGTNLNIMPAKINGYSFKGSSELINGKFSNDLSNINMYYVPSSTNKDNDNSSSSKNTNPSNANSSSVDNINNEGKQQSSNKNSTVTNSSDDMTKSKANIKSDRNNNYKDGNNSTQKSVNSESTKPNQTPAKKNNIKNNNKHSSDNNVKDQKTSNNNSVYIYTCIFIVVLAIIITIYFILRKKGKHFK